MGGCRGEGRRRGEPKRPRGAPAAKSPSSVQAHGRMSEAGRRGRVAGSTMSSPPGILEMGTGRILSRASALGSTRGPDANFFAYYFISNFLAHRYHSFPRTRATDTRHHSDRGRQRPSEWPSKQDLRLGACGTGLCFLVRTDREWFLQFWFPVRRKLFRGPENFFEKISLNRFAFRSKSLPVKTDQNTQTSFAPPNWLKPDSKLSDRWRLVRLAWPCHVPPLARRAPLSFHRSPWLVGCL